MRVNVSELSISIPRNGTDEVKVKVDTGNLPCTLVERSSAIALAPTNLGCSDGCSWKGGVEDLGIQTYR